MVTPAVKREAVAHLQAAHGMSERRACQIIDCCRMSIRYQSTRPDDPVLRDRIRFIAHERRRFGYRRIHVLLRGSRSITNACSGFIAKRSCRSGAGVAENARSVRVRLCLYRQDPMNAGHWTLCLMPLRMVGVYASCAWLTTVRANA